MRLANKTALITGGNSGIDWRPRDCSWPKARGSPSPDAIRRRWRRRPKSSGPTCWRSWPMPPTSPRRARGRQGGRKVRQARHRVANAGISASTPVGGTSLATFESVLKTNITAVFFTVQAAAPHISDGGSIILNGSVISVLGSPGYAAYAASKAGVRAMARVMASELSPRRHPRQCGVARRHEHADLESQRRRHRKRSWRWKVTHLESHSARDVSARRKRSPRAVLFLASDDCVEHSGRRKSSSMAAPLVRRPARRSIAGNSNATSIRSARLDQKMISSRLC